MAFKKIILGFILLAFCVNIKVIGQQNDSLIQKVEELEKALDILKRMKITGWLQVQYQIAESKGAPNFDGGDFGANSNSRFMVRRGRIKFTYSHKLTQYVFQLNATERGVNLVEFFAKITDPWTQSFAFTGGVMNRPFGFEIEQSSSVRETPERSRYTQILMPNERDLGAKITYEPGKEHALYGLKIDAGFFDGPGIAVPGTNSSLGSTVNDGVNEFDSFQDFIGRLAYYKNSKNEKYRYGIGVSHYNGSIVNRSNIIFSEIEKSPDGYIFAAADTTNRKFKGKGSSRRYVGSEFF